MVSEQDIESTAREVLRALAIRKNVILAGPPGTGKSRILNQIRDLFVWNSNSTGTDPSGVIPIPPAVNQIPAWFPSPTQETSRKVFPTVFDQNTKYRDFMRGLVPKIDTAGAFIVTEGTLYRASVHAALDGSASLVLIDEINRGPAVAAFGSALVGLEADKRLPNGGVETPETQYFELLDDNGSAMDFALPEDVYILAAMNEADTSVEPLDVAFLRRFHIHRLEPNVAVLRAHLGLNELEADLDSANLVEEQRWYEALTQAFSKTNEKILLGRGKTYQLGHGALMHTAAPKTGISEVQAYVAEAWSTIRAHVDEVFFGDTRALADILIAESTDSPYDLVEATFAGQMVRRLVGPERPVGSELLQLLRLIARS